MKTIHIKTYRMKSSPRANHFYILSKGYNAGKPLEAPCPNCFVVYTSDLHELAKLYWICYSLWKTGVYIPLLRGSVIPFLRVSDVSTQIQRVVEKVDEESKAFVDAILQLQQLIHTERLLNKQRILIDKLKAAIASQILDGP